MEQKRVSKWTRTAITAKSATLVAALVVMVILVFAGAGCEQPQMVKLRSRTFTPKRGITTEYRKILADALERQQKRHVYVQLKKHLDMMERADLEEQGVKLLNYIGSMTWHATVSDSRALEFTSSTAVKRRPILGTMLWIGCVQPTDRVTPEIFEAQTIKWIKTEDDRERYSVYFYKDISMEEGRRLIQGLGGKIDAEEALTRGFFVSLPTGARESLMAMDRVKLIDLYPPPATDQNDGSRAWCNTNAVHAAGHDGDGVVLGLWEATGHPRDAHVDLTSARCNIEDVGGVSEHATHVCGTIIGTGTGTAARTGHAPGVSDIRCYIVDNAGPATEVDTAIQNFDIFATNNSWAYTVGWTLVWDPVAGAWVWQFEPAGQAYAQSFFGDYRWSCPAYDELIRNEGVVMVFAAANDRNDPPPGNVTAAQPGDWDQVVGAGSWDGHHTIPPLATAKNVITVGAVNDATNLMADFSSWGPTDDGRIKPDLVAPGVNIFSCDDTDTNTDGTFNHYIAMDGTSMAAPAVTGIVALLIQSYREEYLDTPTSTLTPLPSTIKALLCQSAQDMGNAGPDYRFGYGGVRADAARQLILDKRFREGAILSGNDNDIYEFNVTAGDPHIRVTLAWDDYQAGSANPDPAIINDLDLVVQDPSGNYYTPWHLHVTAHDQAVNPATRNSHNVASTSLIPEADRDRWNNVEQVFVDPALVGGQLAGGTWKVIVEAHALPEAPQRYSLVANYALEGKVDVVLVLDRSGSMGGYASASSTDTKIEVLRQAASHFVKLMKPNVGNQLGIVQFNQDVVAFSPAHQANLSALTSSRATLLENTTVPAIGCGGTTSIGDGLDEALGQFPILAADSERDQVVVLVTDGKENTPKWIADVQPNLINRNIAVYPLGLGYSSGINESKLTDLAKDTGGSYRITDDDLIFRKFFIEILAGAVDWGVVVDPVGELAAGEDVTIPVTVTFDETGATFTAYWEGFDNAIDLTLISPSPSGTVITPAIAASNSQIRFGKHPRYAFYQLDFPLAGSLAGQQMGEWRMKLSGTSQIPSGQKARYSASAFAEGGTKLDVSFGKIAHLTGKAISLKARLMKDGKPLLGAHIDVHCDAPAVGVGNVLNSGKVTPDELKKVGSIKDDPVSLIDGKLQILTKKAGRDILPRKKTDFGLFDDGKHGDGKARDGIYAASFDQSRIPGSYTFRIVASNIPVSGNLTTTREWTSSLYNRVNINPKYSEIDVKRLDQTSDGLQYRIKIAPKDQFDNYLGPGHRIRILISSRLGKHQIELEDNIDGTYTKDILITKQELKVGVKVSIDVDGKQFADVTNTIRLP